MSYVKHDIRQGARQAMHIKMFKLLRDFPPLTFLLRRLTQDGAQSFTWYQTLIAASSICNHLSNTFSLHLCKQITYTPT